MEEGEVEGVGGGGEGEAAGCVWGAVDAGYVDVFLVAALTRVMRAAVPIPAVAAASVLHSAAVGGSVIGDRCCKPTSTNRNKEVSNVFASEQTKDERVPNAITTLFLQEC